MTTSNLDQVIEEVKALSPDDQRKLRDLLDRLLAPAPQMSEEEFERHLLAKGVISEIPPPITDLTPFQNRKLMEVKGEPLSETVVEERR
jgi:transcriptional regulator of acetoin/glycerol metabolism